MSRKAIFLLILLAVDGGARVTVGGYTVAVDKHGRTRSLYAYGKGGALLNGRVYDGPGRLAADLKRRLAGRA